MSALTWIPVLLSTLYFQDGSESVKHHQQRNNEQTNETSSNEQSREERGAKLNTNNKTSQSIGGSTRA